MSGFHVEVIAEDHKRFVSLDDLRALASDKIFMKRVEAEARDSIHKQEKIQITLQRVVLAFLNSATNEPCEPPQSSQN